jgi:catechol 2,3-dioxygenase-like lactoylglutathione lyase family enzyme
MIEQAESESIRTKGFLHITIGVTDLDVATAFYQEILGCELVRRNPIMSFMKTGEDFFVLTKTGVHVPPNPDGPPAPGNTLFHHAMLIDPKHYDRAVSYLSTQGIAYHECTAAGHSTFPGRRHVYIKDPDGNSIELATEVMP